jgi:branched-chain amino acid transport system substrate-binding protein
MARIGLSGFTEAVKVSCEDHETGGPIIIQQWNGSKWNMVSNWISPDMGVVRPLIEADAAKFAKENKIKPRDC